MCGLVGILKPPPSADVQDEHRSERCARQNIPEKRLQAGALRSSDAGTSGVFICRYDLIPFAAAIACDQFGLAFEGVRWRRKFGQLAKVGSTSMKDGLYDWEAEAVHG